MIRGCMQGRPFRPGPQARASILAWSLDQPVPQEQLALQELLALQEQLVPQDLQEQLALQELQEPQAALEPLVRRERQAGKARTWSWEPSTPS